MNPLLKPIYIDWEPGETFGSYRIEKLLSDSVLGNFYEASHVDTGARYILFLLPLGLTKLHRNLAERLLETQRKLEKTDKSCVLRWETVQRIKDRVFLLYEHQNVESLTRYVLNNSRDDENNGLDQETARSLLLQLGNAVRSSRSAGLGHFFISPDFVFVHRGTGKVFLAGCGIFEQLNYRHFETYISSAIHPIGNQDFEKVRFAAIEILSPEIRNLKRTHPRSDFYCLGMCAYFMLIGYKPVRNWMLPTVAREDIDRGWDLFISHCLEYNPDRRFPHVASFIHDLKGLEALHHQPKREGRRVMRTLSQIPLPQSFERRFSPLTLLYLRLGLLGVAGVLAVFSAIVFTEIINSDFSEPEVAAIGPQRVLNRENANLVLYLPAEQIRVQFSGRSSGTFLVANGHLYLRVQPGDYSIHLSSPFLQDKRIRLSATREPLQKHVEMDFGFASLRIKHGAPTAELWAGSNPDQRYFVDYFDNNGNLELSHRFYAGTYHFEMRSQTHRNYAWEIQKLGLDEALQLDAHAEPLPATLSITGSSATNVSINGAAPQPIPATFNEISVEEKIILEFSATGYRNHTKELKLDPAGDHRLVAPVLQPLIGTVNFVFKQYGRLIESTDELDGFQLELPGKPPIGVNQLPLQLSAGTHQWKISHPDLETQTLETVIQDRERSSVTLDFIYKPGTVVLDSRILTESSITVDGNRVDPVNGRLELAAKRDFALKWEIRDFQPAQISIKLQPGQVWLWSPQWQPFEGPEKGESWQIPYTNVDLEWIPAGDFRMGSPLEEEMRLPNEGPQTWVEISSGFWAMRHEVKQAFYQSVARKNPSRYRNHNHPVESINWFEAMEFARQLTEKERLSGRLPKNYVYRLPTEAEWEYMARGGVEESLPFHFGHRASSINGQFSGFYPRGNQEASRAPAAEYGTVAAGLFEANGFGLFDIHGNVAEWTLDHYLDRLPGGKQKDLYRGSGGRGRVVRGGSWADSAHRTRLAVRSAVNEDTRRDSVGVRLVLAPEL